MKIAENKKKKSGEKRSQYDNYWADKMFMKPKTSEDIQKVETPKLVKDRPQTEEMRVNVEELRFSKRDFLNSFDYHSVDLERGLRPLLDILQEDLADLQASISQEKLEQMFRFCLVRFLMLSGRYQWETKYKPFYLGEVK
jgi:hypothetical protein